MVRYARNMNRIRTVNRLVKVLEAMRVRRKQDGRMAYELKYYGATPGRWSGAGGLNVQNMNRSESEGLDLRKLIVAPEGKTLAVADFSQIEARVLLWLAGDAATLIESVQTGWQPVIERLRSLSDDTLIAASCYGTFVLGEAGVLDGIEATTTWWLHDLFRQRYPAVRLDADQTLADGGRCMTAGAMTAHADLTLHVLRRLFGAALARQVGSIMLVDRARTSQRPYMVLRQRFDDPLIQRASDWLVSRIAAAVSVEALADALHVSYRTLHRRFQAAIGMPPLAYLQDLRVEHAKELLESTLLSFEQIVARVGYNDVSAFRRLFVRRAGLSPAQYRQRFRR